LNKDYCAKWLNRNTKGRPGIETTAHERNYINKTPSAEEHTPTVTKSI